MHVIIIGEEVIVMKDKLLYERILQLTDYQKESLAKVMLDYIQQNESENKLYPDVCPT